MLAAKVIVPALLAPYVTQPRDGDEHAVSTTAGDRGRRLRGDRGPDDRAEFRARFFAVLLILFVMAATFYADDFWNQTAPDNAKTIIDALKNLSIIGALFMIAGYGRGRRTAEPAYGDV